MSELSPKISSCEDKPSEKETTSKPERKRKLSVEVCEVEPPKKEVIIIDLDDSDSEPNETGGKSALPQESEVAANVPIENLVNSAISPHEPKSTSICTYPVKISAEGIVGDEFNKKSRQDSGDESTSIIKDANVEDIVVDKSNEESKQDESTSLTKDDNAKDIKGDESKLDLRDESTSLTEDANAEDIAGDESMEKSRGDLRDESTSLTEDANAEYIAGDESNDNSKDKSISLTKDTNVENITGNESNDKSKPDLIDESIPSIKEANAKPSVILRIRTDYASDGELEDSPLPELPETSPISDGSVMSPITDNQNEESVEAVVTDPSQTSKQTGEKSCDASQKDAKNELLPKGEDQEIYESEEPADEKPKGIRLVNFCLEEYTVPDKNRYGTCRLLTEFQKLSVVGEGSYGVVYKVLDMKNNNNVLALKKIKYEKRNNSKKLPIQALREINILKILDHPNIISSHGVAVGSNFKNTYLILEYCEYDLSKIIDDEKSSNMLQESQIKCIMLQLFEGLRYIHCRCVLHRDLTCSNVLFTSQGILKIGDFGSSRHLILNTPMTPNVVSRWYRAPELLFGEINYTPAVDVWASGCIFGETLILKPLFKADSDMKMIAAVIDLLGTPNERTWPGISQLPVLKIYDLVEQPENRLRARFRDLSEMTFSLLEQLLTYDPQRRITANQALKHLYFLTEPMACSPEGLIPILKVADEIVMRV